MLLPAVLAGRLGIEGLVDETVDPRDRDGAANPGRKVMTLVSAMALGADCIDDCDVLRSGQTDLVLGHGVSAPSTLGTFLRAFTFGHVRQLDRILADGLRRAWAAGAGPGDDQLVVDVDSFVGEVYGYAQRSTRGVRGFVEELIPRVARAGATGAKLLRADAGFWNGKIMARLQAAGWTYSIGVRQQPHVKAAIAAIAEQDWQTLEDYPEGGEAQIAQTMLGRQRLIARRTRLIGAQAEMWPDWRHHAFLTNRTDAVEQVEAEHRQHAVVKLAIRDLKDQALAHFPSGKFLANAAWTVIAALAHNLLRWTTLIGLPDTVIPTARTIRRRLLTVPGRITRTARTVTLRLPARWPWEADFLIALERLRAVPPAHLNARPRPRRRSPPAPGVGLPTTPRPWPPRRPQLGPLAPTRSLRRHEPPSQRPPTHSQRPISRRPHRLPLGPWIEAKLAAIPARVLFVSHGASRTGAPLMLLQFLRWLRDNSELELAVLLVRNGPLSAQFSDVARVTSVDDASMARLGTFHRLGAAELILPPPHTGMSHTERVARRLSRAALVRDLRHRVSGDQPPDLIYVNSVISGPLLSVFPDTTPVITHVHELGFQLRILRHDDPLGVAQILARTNRYIAASNGVAEALRLDYGIDPGKIDVSHSFIAIDDIEQPDRVDRARSSLGIGPDTLVVGSIGTIEWRKGADLFIQVAREVLQKAGGDRNVVFLWVGGAGEAWWEEAVRHDLESLDLIDRVRFIGAVADPKPFFEIIDVFVLTSRSDPFPLVCLEAAAEGKPIVSFNAGGMTEFLEPSERLLMPYLDTSAMAERIHELLGAPNERKLIGDRLARRVRERHRLESAAPILLGHIEQALRS